MTKAEFFKLVAAQESGGNYEAQNGRTGAFGKYQIMPNNWPSWAEQAGIGSDAPNNPANQEIVAQYKLGEYFDKYGAEGALVAWYSGETNGARWRDGAEDAIGEGGHYSWDAKQGKGDEPSVREYVQQSLGRSNGTELPFVPNMDAPTPSDYYNIGATMALQGRTPDGSPIAYYEDMKAKGAPTLKPLNFWEGVEHGFESSTFGQWQVHSKYEKEHNVFGRSTSDWMPSDSDFNYIDTVLKSLPDLGETKYRIMTTVKSREHMMTLITYEQERRKREERAEATGIFTAGTAGSFVGSFLNPVNFIPMVGVGGRVANLARAGFARTLTKASVIGAQNAALNVADEYGAHVIGGTKFNPKEAALMGFVAGTGMEMLAQYVGKGMRRIDELYFKAQGTQERMAAQLVGNVRPDGFTEPDFGRAADGLDFTGMTSKALEGLNIPLKNAQGQKAKDFIHGSKTVNTEDGMLSAIMANEEKLKIITLDSAKKLGRRMGFPVDAKTRGFMIPNTDSVIAIKENIKDAADLDNLIYHEYGVHHAKGVMDEKTWGKLMKYTEGQMKNPKGVWFDAVGRAKSNDPEEVLAHFIELGGNDHNVKKFKHEVKEGLHKLGIAGLDDSSITGIIKDITWKEAVKKRGYTLDPDGASVIGGARFSVDNPIHPHNYSKYIDTVDEINASHNQKGITHWVKTCKYFGSDFGKASESPSKTLQKVMYDCIRDVYQTGRNNEFNAEHIKEMELGRLQPYDEKVRQLCSNWMERDDVLKRISIEGHDRLIDSFYEQVIKLNDNTYGALEVRKKIEADPEVIKAADVLHEKWEVMVDELKHSATYNGIADMPNILGENYKTFDQGFNRRIDPVKHRTFINNRSFGGDIQKCIDWLKTYGLKMACRKLEANRQRLASKRNVQPADITDAQLMEWLEKQSGKWAFGIVDQDTSNPEKWMHPVSPRAIENPLDFLNDRFIGDSSYEMEFPDGSLFSFDANLRDFNLDKINQWQTNRTAGEIAFRSKFKSDADFKETREQIIRELGYAKQGAQSAGGMTQISDEEMKDILNAFDVMLSKLRGKPLSQEVALQGNSMMNDAVGLLGKAAYTFSGNNIGVSSIAEVIQSVATSGTDIIPRLAAYMTNGTTMHDLKELVELNHMQDLHVRMGGRPLNTDDMQRKYGDNWFSRFFDKTSAGLAACGRFTNTLNQLPRLTETWTNLMKASAMKDLSNLAHGKEMGMLSTVNDPQFLKEVGVVTPEMHEALLSDIRKYLPEGKTNSELYGQWRTESPRTYLQFTKFVEDTAIRGVTRQMIGNTNTTFKSAALGQLASFFMTFTYMATHSQTLRLLNRPKKDLILNTALSMIGGLASYSAYTAVMAETKYAFDEKKKKDYYQKKFNPTMYITAALTRGAALAPLAYVQNTAEIFGVSPATVRTTVGSNNSKIAGAGDLVGNAVNQMPIANAIFNMGASVKNLGELAAYKATAGKYGSTFSQGELNTLSQALPTGNFFATQLMFEALKKELNLPKKERKAKGGN